MKVVKLSLFIFLSIQVVASIGVKDCYGATAQELLDQAKILYQDRETPASLQAAHENLVQALATVQEDGLKYDILILSSRVTYYQAGKMTERSLKMAGYEQAYGFAKEAQSLDEQFADGFYYYSIALGRWAEQKGVFESLSRKKELFQNLDSTQERLARDGSAGEAIDYFGADRIYGRVYYKLPAIAGGSRAKSLAHLKRAYDNAPDAVINAHYYAETLYDGGSSSEKATACQIADEVLAKALSEFPADRKPETLGEMSDLRGFRATIKCGS
jgi:tetratricopeptide (TPR) repeat protein